MSSSILTDSKSVLLVPSVVSRFEDVDFMLAASHSLSSSKPLYVSELKNELFNNVFSFELGS